MSYNKILRFLTILTLTTLFSSFAQQPKIEFVATWNMKWLGEAEGKNLDKESNVKKYVEYIKNSKASLIAVQEIGAHYLNKNGKVINAYLDLIKISLSSEGSGDWEYMIDYVNGSQRLGFFYDRKVWDVKPVKILKLGKPFGGRLRKPFVANATYKKNNANVTFSVVNVHLKAMKGAKHAEKRAKQMKVLGEYIKNNPSVFDNDIVICGDFNIFSIDGETVDAGLTNNGFVYVKDSESTNIYNDNPEKKFKPMGIFDRFYINLDFSKEVESAKSIVGNDELVDAMEKYANGDYKDFRENLSDHLLVKLAVDVSRER